jgi:cytochrome c556
MPKLDRGSRAAALAIAASAALFSWQASGAEDAKVQAAKTEAEGIIFERQQIMDQLGKDADALGKIVAGQLPRDRLAATTHAIAQGAKDSVEAFRQQVPGGHAKPEAWSNNADFTARMEKFAKNAEVMAKAGETGNMAEVLNVMVDALPCKECHDLYREKKKS